MTEVLSRQRVQFYEGILVLLHERGLKDEAELLTPFTIAAEYWENGDDAEVLDRLNPEVRKLVEQIIEAAAGPPLE